jgi:hypothetical protein
MGGDGLGGDCSPCYTYNYTDNGNLWLIQEDIEPGIGFIQANSSGITFLDQTCSGPGNPVKVCGPYWEWNGDKRYVNGVLTGEENVSELSGALYNVPGSDQIFSIGLHLPQYSFAGCAYNISSTGCSYEGYGPSIAGVWALDANNGSIAVSLAEGNSNQLSVGISTAAFVNGQYDASLSKNLVPKVPTIPYTPNHTLTIATDRNSYIEIWIDNILEYSNSTLPVSLAGNSLTVNFYQFDDVDNMTLGTVWSNYTAYSGSNVTVTGLQNGMSLLVSGKNGFNETIPANSSGTAVADVTDEPANLNVSIQYNGNTIDTYGSLVNAGAVLNFIVNTSTSTISSSYTTTITKTYTVTNTTTYVTTTTP